MHGKPEDLIEDMRREIEAMRHQLNAQDLRIGALESELDGMRDEQDLRIRAAESGLERVRGGLQEEQVRHDPKRTY